MYFIDGKVTNNGTWTLKNPTNVLFYDPVPTFDHDDVHQRGGRDGERLAGERHRHDHVAVTMPIINNGTLNVTKGHAQPCQVGGVGHRHLQRCRRAQPLTWTLGPSTSPGPRSPAPGTLNLNGGGAAGGVTGGRRNLVFNGGTLTGGGTITLPAGTTATFATSISFFIDGGTTLVNNGTVTSERRDRSYFIDGKVTNNGTWTLKNPTKARCSTTGTPRPTTTFTNAAGGMVNVSPGERQRHDHFG